jgi:[ribosomal protein S18]-alanine N-acetyltransferase
VRVRGATVADIPAIMELERQTPSASHWSQAQYEALFVSQGPQRVENVAWVVAHEQKVAGKTHRAESVEVVAFLIAHRLENEWELQNLAVAANARRQGLGTLLLRQLISHASERSGSRIWLEVRESNRTARALYSKLDFEETGLRKGYYSNPPEDAILYQLSL